jgi:hypothetical protein
MTQKGWSGKVRGNGRMLAGVGGLLLVLAVAAGLAACRPGTNVRLELPPTPQLFGSLPWGMINATYTKGFAKPDPDSPVLAVLRGGNVVSILKRGEQQERQGVAVDYWYQVRMDGQDFWVFGSLLTMFGLEMQARTSAAIIQEKLFGNQAVAALAPPIPAAPAPGASGQPSARPAKP